MKLFIPLIILLCANVCFAQDQKTDKVTTTLKDELTEKEMKKFYSEVGNTLRYPSDARRKGREGTVIVEFAINPDGTTSDFSIVQWVSQDLEDEALRTMRVVAAKTPWKKPETTRWISVPLKFKLG